MHQNAAASFTESLCSDMLIRTVTDSYIPTGSCRTTFANLPGIGYNYPYPADLSTRLSSELLQSIFVYSDGAILHYHDCSVLLLFRVSFSYFSFATRSTR